MHIVHSYDTHTRTKVQTHTDIQNIYGFCYITCINKVLSIFKALENYAKYSLFLESKHITSLLSCPPPSPPSLRNHVPIIFAYRWQILLPSKYFNHQKPFADFSFDSCALHPFHCSHTKYSTFFFAKNFDEKNEITWYFPICRMRLFVLCVCWFLAIRTHKHSYIIRYPLYVDVHVYCAMPAYYISISLSLRSFSVIYYI